MTNWFRLGEEPQALLGDPLHIFRHDAPLPSDFVVRLTNGLVVLLEGKGEADEKDDAKATAARRWVQAVNSWGELGAWTHSICYDAGDLSNQLKAACDDAMAMATEN